MFSTSNTILPCQPENDFEDFFEHALYSLLTTDTQGLILRANPQLYKWLGYNAGDLAGKRFADLLSIGSKIYYETVLSPSLRINGSFDEVSLELAGKEGKRIQVFANACERRDADNQPLFIRFTLFKATDRRAYEQNLQGAKKQAEESLDEERANALLREQFIAVLGHDLRNPLTAILTGSSLLQKMELGPISKRVATTINGSAVRMSEMIKNVMDFARVRLGGGIVITCQPTVIETIISQVVEELRTAWPARTIETVNQVSERINCDGPRIAQLVSNLVANALMHGAADKPVIVRANVKDDFFELLVCNEGNPVLPSILENLFQPFKRESNMPGQQGFGLGLYIASEIARAHNGTLTATSDTVKTIFTFRMQA